ncbi:PEGA domain-containing protein [bacterium]|nr:PEGA domain-containing protein [candidate division CSSED10-310 bacterium]
MRIVNGLSLGCVWVMIWLIGLGPAVQAAGLMPDDIVAMHRQGFDERRIVSEIQAKGIDFEVNLPVMERFIREGISQGVLEVLFGYDPHRRMDRRETISLSGPAQSGVAVLTQPPGLNVSIDGQDHGVTPSLSNKLKHGKHVIRVEHPLFFTRQEEIDFDGSKDIILNWKMEPREPLIRVAVNIEKDNVNEPWSWIIRPRNFCPGCDVTVKLEPWKSMANAGEAVFLLSEETKRLFRGTGTGCLELNIWQGEVRRDMPLRRLPTPTARYYLSDIRIEGIEIVDISIDVTVRELNPSDPEVAFKGDSGYLIQAESGTGEEKKQKTYEEIIETLDGVIQ